MKRAAIGLLVLVIAAWAALPIAAPAIAKPLARGFARDWRLAVTVGGWQHAGLGLAASDVRLATVGGAVEVVRADSVALRPALAWPPVRLAVARPAISRDGIAAWKTELLARESAWAAGKRGARFLAGALGTQTWRIDVAGASADGAPLGDATLVVTPASDDHTTIAIGSETIDVDSTRDAFAIVLTGPLDAERRVPAPDWAGVVAPARRWSGDERLRVW